MSQLCARSGITFKCASRATRLENISPSTCAEKASAPIRGSRLVGAESIKKFTVPESAEVFAEPQPTRSNAPHNSAAPIIAKAIAALPHGKESHCTLTRVAVHQFPHKKRFLRPPPRHNQFIHPHPRKNKSPERIRNRKRRKNRSGAHQILRPRAPLPCPANQLIRKIGR